MHDRPPGVLDHLLPVLQFQALPVVSEEHLSDGVGRADAVVVGNKELKVHPLLVSPQDGKMSTKLRQIQGCRNGVQRGAGITEREKEREESIIDIRDEPAARASV